MSNRLIKNGSSIELASDEIIAVIRILKSGKVQVEAPTVHPRDLCKILANVQYDLLYASFQPTEIPRIQSPV